MLSDCVCHCFARSHVVYIVVHFDILSDCPMGVYLMFVVGSPALDIVSVAYSSFEL